MQHAMDSAAKPTHVAICLDAGVYHRYRAVLRHLCVGLIDEVATVRLVTSARQAEALSLGPVKVSLYDELRWPLKTQRLRRLLDMLHDQVPTVAHAMSAVSYPIAEAVAGEYDADLVYQITSLEDIDACAASGYSGPRRIVCASTPLRDRFISVTGVAPDKVALVRPGVVCAAEPTCFREPGRAASLLTTADLRPDTGVDKLIEAVAILHARERHFLTFLLGEGPDEHRLRQLAKQRGLSSSVVFAQPSGTALKAMEGADIFVQPGVEHAISARSLQALGQGMAVIGVRGGVHDAYLPDETAVLLDEPDAGKLADAIERFLDDRELARRIAQGAIDHMKAHHTMSAMAEQTGAIYREMAAQRATIPIRR